jgi:ParB/RepB/Spo0J family partition protein
MRNQKRDDWRNSKFVNLSHRKIMNESNQPHPVVETVVKIPRELIERHPLNRHPDPAKLTEIVESMRQHGQTQPGTVRPLPGGRYQIVDGERRFVSSGEAGITYFKAMVRIMSDAEAAEEMLRDNLEREQLTAREEATQYQWMLQMQDADGAPIYTRARLAQRINRTEMHISHMLRLLTAPEQALLAMEEKILTKAVVLEITKIADSTDQLKATREILAPVGQKGVMDTEKALEHINANYRRSLRKAPFDLKDVGLFPVVMEGEERVMGGDCLSCPHLLANAHEEKTAKPVGGGGGIVGLAGKTCLRPGCFEQKLRRQTARDQADALAMGAQLMSEKEAETIFDHEGAVLFASGYIDLMEKPDPALMGHFHAEKVPTWKALIAESNQEVPRWLAKNKKTGKVHEVCRWEAAVGAVNIKAEADGKPPLIDLDAWKKQAPPDQAYWDEEAERKALAEARQKAVEDERALFDEMDVLRYRLEQLARVSMLHLLKKLYEMVVRHLVTTDALKLIVKHQKIPVTALDSSRPTSEEYQNAVLLESKRYDSSLLLAMLVLVLLAKRLQTFGAQDEVFRGWMETLPARQEIQDKRREDERHEEPEQAPDAEPEPAGEQIEERKPAYAIYCEKGSIQQVVEELKIPLGTVRRWHREGKWKELRSAC